MGNDSVLADWSRPLTTIERIEKWIGQHQQQLFARKLNPLHLFLFYTFFLAARTFNLQIFY